MSEPFGMVPREAARRFRELKPNAYGLFTVLCGYRNATTGQCNPTVDELMRETGLSKTRFYDARADLIKKGWAKWPETDGGQIELMAGFVPKSGTNGAVPVPKCGTEQSLNAGQVVPKCGTEQSLNAGLHIGRTDHEHTKNIPFSAGESEPTTEAVEQALYDLFGWRTLIKSPLHQQQVGMAAQQLLGLRDGYGAEYAPLPERIARFPDFAKAMGMQKFGPNAVVSWWTRCVEWQRPRSKPAARKEPELPESIRANCPVCSTEQAFETNATFPGQGFCHAEDCYYVFDGEQHRWIPESQAMVQALTSEQ